MRFGGTAYLCATEHLRGVTPDEADCLALDERRQLDELLRAAREVPENYEDLTSQLGPPPPVEVPTEPPREPEEPSRDDLDIGMDAVEQMTRLEGAGETASSTEIPYGETAGSPQFKGVHLEEPLDDEQEKTGEDEAELVGPEDILMTKSQGEPNSSTASSFQDKRQYDREISFHQLPEGDVPLYQEVERVQWDEWVTHGSVKIHSPVKAAKIRQQVHRERRLHSRFAYRNKNAGLLDPAGNRLPVKAKVRLVIQGQHCPDNAQGLVRTDAPTAHRTAVSVFLQSVSSMVR